MMVCSTRFPSISYHPYVTTKSPTAGSVLATNRPEPWSGTGSVSWSMFVSTSPTAFMVCPCSVTSISTFTRIDGSLATQIFMVWLPSTRWRTSQSNSPILVVTVSESTLVIIPYISSSGDRADTISSNVIVS